MMSHDCRTCAKDRECDSGACNVADGTCVGQGAVLYASPTGSSADLCTKTSPCSLRHAAELIDMTRTYVVLLPGRHAGGAIFSGKAATIAGNDATIDDTDSVQSAVNITDGSSISVRDIRVEEHLSDPSSDALGVINVIQSNLTVDNLQSDTKKLSAIYGNTGTTVTIRRASFIDVSLVAFRLVADTCFFHNGGPAIQGSVELTNSIIVAGSSTIAINISSSDPAHPVSKIINNTFVGGGIYCETSTAIVRQFSNNIFYNYSMIQVVQGCTYQYNLAVPTVNLGGNGNTTGDPMFADIANGNFHLKAGSVAIDAADPAIVSIDRDYDGTHRPQGTRLDIGAFEYVP
jgi:hypothetical protein